MKKTSVNRLFAALVPLAAVLVLFVSVANADSGLADGDQQAASLQLASFSAKPTSKGVVLYWSTGPESDLVGFNVYRAEGAGEWARLNSELIVATGESGKRNDYAWTDTGARAGRSYFYRVEHLTSTGQATRHEPLRIKAGAPFRLGLDEFNAQSLASLWPAVIGAIIAVGGFSIINRRR